MAYFTVPHKCRFSMACGTKPCKTMETSSNFCYVSSWYILDINLFWFDAAFNPDCFICMNWCDCPWFTAIPTCCFAEIFPYQCYFVTNCVIIIFTLLVFERREKIRDLGWTRMYNRSPSHVHCLKPWFCHSLFWLGLEMTGTNSSWGGKLD